MNKSEFLVVSVITLIVVVIWVTSNFIHTRNAAIPNPDSKQYLEPVEPQFDQETLDKIGRLTTPTATLGPLPSPSPTKSASPSATARPTATPKASPQPSASSIFP